MLHFTFELLHLREPENSASAQFQPGANTKSSLLLCVCCKMLKVVNIEDDLQLRDNKYTCEKFENANKDIYCLKEDTQCCENYLPRPDFLFSRILVTYLNISPILTLPTFPNSLQLYTPRHTLTSTADQSSESPFPSAFLLASSC